MHFKCCIQKNWSIDDSSNCSEIRENSQIVVVINRVNYCNCICKTSSCKGAARSWSRGGSHQTLTGVESLRRWGEAGAEAGWGEFSFFLWLLILLLPRCCIAFILIFNCVASISLHINPPINEIERTNKIESNLPDWDLKATSAWKSFEKTANSMSWFASTCKCGLIGKPPHTFSVKIGILSQPAWTPPPSPNVGIPKKEKNKCF